MYSYEITDNCGRVVKTSTTDGHDQNTADDLIWSALPLDALVLCSDHDRQERNGWSYSVSWVTVEMDEDADPIVWNIRIW